MTIDAATVERCVDAVLSLRGLPKDHNGTRAIWARDVRAVLAASGWGEEIERLREIVDGANVCHAASMQRIASLEEALREIIPRFERCVQHAGSTEEYAKLATANARAALASAPAPE